MADDKILKQLDNDAFVIGYQPDLEYKKDRTAVGKAISSNNEDTNYDPENDTKLYSKTLNGFSKNMPSNVLKDINYVLKNIVRLKNKLAKRFNEDRALMNNPFYDSSSTIDPDIIIGNNPNGSNNYFNNIENLIDAGNNGDDDFANRFEQQYNSIFGSVIPSLINKLSKIEAKLSALSSVYKELYYGKPNITLDEAQKIDTAYLIDLKINERNDDKGKINYLTISFDAILNRIVSYTVFQDNKSAIKVAKVIDSHENTQATSNDMDLIKKMFDDVQKELELRSRGYKRNEDLELIQKSMYNYYEKRKYLNDLYSLYSSNQESKFLGRKVTEYTKNLNEAVKNVGRVLMYNQSYLDQITVLEKQKYNLQKISGSTSSNS